MSDTSDHKLEAMLRSRRLEPASADLAQRILVKVQRLPQQHMMTLTQWVQQLCAAFHLPRPAYVLAGTLLMGFVLGLTAPLETPSEDTGTMSVQSFLYADEDLL